MESNLTMDSLCSGLLLQKTNVEFPSTNDGFLVEDFFFLYCGTHQTEGTDLICHNLTCSKRDVT